MSKSTLKLTLWLFLSLLLMAFTALLISGIGSLIAYFQQGADPAAALNILPNAPSDLYVTVDWLPDELESGRVLDDYTRQQVELAYQWAWVQWNISYLRGEPYGLDTYFANPALRIIRAAVQDAASNRLTVRQINTAHQLRLNLYAADGNLIAFTDQAAQISSIVQELAQSLLFSGETAAVYDVVMLQQEGRWHIRDLVRRQATVYNDADPALLPDLPSLDSIAGINYYPQATPWDRFWTDYDSDVIAADFARIRDLGLNSVRVFVGYEAFGGADVQADRLLHLGDLLNQAQNQQLGVIVTLFDFRTDYDPLLWPQSDRHLEAVVLPFARHPALLAWDIKNEPDLDYRANGGAVLVNAWLAHTARHLRQLAPTQRVTIGWSSAQAAVALANQVDFVSFHDYLPPESFPTRLAALRDGVGQDKPIVLGEYGLPTWNSVFPNGHTEAEQAVYYADMQMALRQADLSGALAWTLYDFSTVPASVAGRFPWQTGPQAHLGILRADGTAKPAAALLQPDADLTVTPVPAYARFLKPFWLMLFAVGGLVGVVVVWRVARWRRKRRVQPTGK